MLHSHRFQDTLTVLPFTGKPGRPLAETRSLAILVHRRILILATRPARMSSHQRPRTQSRRNPSATAAYTSGRSLRWPVTPQPPLRGSCIRLERRFVWIFGTRLTRRWQKRQREIPPAYRLIHDLDELSLCTQAFVVTVFVLLSFWSISFSVCVLHFYICWRNWA